MIVFSKLGNKLISNEFKNLKVLIKSLILSLFLFQDLYTSDNFDEKYEAEGVAFQDLKSDSCTMTVFVHGTTISLWNGIFGSKNKKKKEKLRKSIIKGFLCGRQPIAELGLQRIGPEERSNLEKNLYRNLTCKFYNKIKDEVESDKKQKNFSTNYCFGWCGDLNKKCRRKEASNLYEQLLHESKSLEKRLKIPVKIHLITHSHGGNVALNLALEEKDKKNKLKIDQLVLLGCPIQKETCDLWKSDIFKKVYNFYSNQDFIQIADFISTSGISCRKLRSNYKKTNLRQIRIKAGKYGPSHAEFFLWGFKKWPHVGYRKKFPLHPVPIVVFIPLLTHFIDSANLESGSTEFLVNLDQNKEKIHVKSETSKYEKSEFCDFQNVTNQASSFLR